MISLKRIVEQQGSEQFYDLGKDFFNFKRMMDGTDEQIKQKFEQSIGSKLVGKRIRARASRGYKQFVKSFDFDVTKISLDDYYDNYVVVAYDNTTPKPKEYFLKPGFKIQVLGPATGEPSPQKGGDPKVNAKLNVPNDSIPPKENPSLDQHQPMAQAPVGQTSSKPKLQEDDDYYDAYSIDQIAKDITPWLSKLLLKPETPIRDFVKGIGWMRDFGRGKSIALYDVILPIKSLNKKISPNDLKALINNMSTRRGTIETIYNVERMKLSDSDDEWNIRIKKTMKDTTAL